eukprot:5929985-Pleurochrysis_carterae.AAC.2
MSRVVAKGLTPPPAQQQLRLSGQKLQTLPKWVLDDKRLLQSVRTIHINKNRFATLPAALRGKLERPIPTVVILPCISTAVKGPHVPSVQSFSPWLISASLAVELHVARCIENP